MKRVVLPLLVICAALFSTRQASAENYTIADVTSNMSVYESNTLDKVHDNDFGTVFWSSIAQAVDHYIQVDLGSILPLQEVNLYFSSGDQPAGVKVEISSNGSSYEQIGSFSQSEIGNAASNYLYSCNAVNKTARYVRMSLTQASNSWLKVAEIQIPVPEEGAPSRTITVGVNDESMGVAYIGSKGTVSTTAEGPVMIMAEANPGYAFICWTLDDEEVSQSAEMMDNTEGDKNYVANFAPAPYDDFCTPAVTTGGNKRAQSKGEILNAEGVIEGSTLVFYPNGGAANQAWSNRTDMVQVESGASFDLKVTYGADGWDDLSVFMMTSSDDYDLIYGPYEGAWASDGSTLTLFSNINASEDEATADASDGSIIFPITIPQDLNSGDAVVVRFVIHGSSLNGNPCATGIGELNYCDYVFYVAKGMSQIVVNAQPSNGGSVAVDDSGFGETAGASIEEGGSATLKAAPEAGYQFDGWYNAEDVLVSSEAEYTIDNITESATFTAKFSFIPVAERTVTVVSSDPAKGSVAIVEPETDELSVASTGIVTVSATPADEDNIFVNWTDANGDEVSTDAVYSYDKEGDITLTANFKSYYVVTVDNSQQGGTITVSDASGSINDGTKVLEGTQLTVTVKLNPGKGLEALNVNGNNVLAEFEKTDSYTFTLSESTVVSAVYGAAKCILSYESTGSGYVEVWSSDTYTDEGPFPVDPAGDKYPIYSNLTYGENIYIFLIGVDGGTMQSFYINGEDYTDNEDLAMYGDIEYPVEGDVHIEANFSGNDITGVEEASADEAVKVYAVNGGVNVVAENATADIYNINGMYVRSAKVGGTEFVSLPAGLYAVVVNGGTYKVVVR